MKRKPYLPTIEAQRVIWLNTFAARLPNYAAMFNIQAADVAAVTAMSLIYSFIIGLITESRQYTEDLTKFKDLLSFAPSGTTLGPLPVLTPGVAPALTEAGIFTFIGGIVTGIKSKKSVYTEGIGENLGIIGDETIFIADDYLPILTGKAMPGSVKISFEKNGVEAMSIYSHPVGSTDPDAWEHLANDHHSPYHDTRALAVAGKPEVREYRARGVLGDVEIGQWSAVIKVTFSG
ncbi:MAG TPA: hypothetical protein VI757_10080 [Bacteroidia bacterium]|nr:hypothetical protein [Bacteroidia bacterium]